MMVKNPNENHRQIGLIAGKVHVLINRVNAVTGHYSALMARGK